MVLPQQWKMLGPPSVERADSHRAAAEFTRYMQPVVKERRASPRDDVISAHDRLDPFLLEQPPEQVAVNGVRSDVELLE